MIKCSYRAAQLEVSFQPQKLHEVTTVWNVFSSFLYQISNPTKSMFLLHISQVDLCKLQFGSFILFHKYKLSYWHVHLHTIFTLISFELTIIDLSLLIWLRYYILSMLHTWILIIGWNVSVILSCFWTISHVRIISYVKSFRYVSRTQTYFSTAFEKITIITCFMLILALGHSC